MTTRRIRDDRLFAALCHAGIFLGIWGLISTGAIWAYRKDRSRTVRFQGAQALIYQLVAQALILAAAAFCILWKPLHHGNRETLQGMLGLWANGGVLAGLFDPHLRTVAVVQGLLCFIASLLLVLSLLGLEPSYPIAGFIARRVLGLRTERPQLDVKEAEKPAEAEQKEKEKEKEGEGTPAPGGGADGPL